MSTEQTPPEKKLVHERTYTITVKTYDDKSITWSRENKGFSIIELIGMLSVVDSDLKELIRNLTINKNGNADRNSTSSPLFHRPESQTPPESE